VGRVWRPRHRPARAGTAASGGRIRRTRHGRSGRPSPAGEDLSGRPRPAGEDLSGRAGGPGGRAGTVDRVGTAGYFDAATAAPLHPAGAAALQAALADGWADPGRLYRDARRARQLLDAARQATADCLGVRPDEVIFTESGTASCQLAVLGALRGRTRAGPVFVHSTVEHSAVLLAGREHVARGGSAVPVPVDRSGRVEAGEFAAAVTAPGVGAAALMSANHEVGTQQPLAPVAAACQSAGVPLIVDAAQSLGRAEVPDGWSVLAGSARKWGGPPGVGVLVVRTGVRWLPPLPHQEYAGLPGIVAAAAALRAAAGEAHAEDDRLRPLVDRIRIVVARTVPDVEVLGDPVHRLPNVVTFSCLYLDGEALLHELDRHGFAVSSGSSCTAQTLRPSHVLEAMGVLSHGNIRVSLHRGSTGAEVDRFLAVLPAIVAELRARAGVVGL
jgi:cysteine desulfurase